MPVARNLPVLPFGRSDLVHIAPQFRALQADSPVTLVRTPAGDPAWLILGHDNVRTLLADARLGRSHADPERAAVLSNAAILGRPYGNPATERADHARWRSVMGRGFTSRRMEALRPRVRRLVDGLLDGLAERTPPVDLHETLCFPLPVLVICELLGIPFEDREAFRVWSDQSVDLTDRDRAFEALARLTGYMGELVARKRAQPTDDVVSELIRAADDDGLMTEDEMVGSAAGLLFAGHETTVTRLDFGILLLLVHPDQGELLRRDPALTDGAVEEILRVSTTTIGIVPRYALEDVEYGGVTIRAGDMVLLGNDAANRDAHAFADPDRFDIRRERNPHLTFGHGARFCVGAPLARIELQSVFPALLRRFPALRLAVPVEHVREKSHLVTGGLEELPVTW